MQHLQFLQCMCCLSWDKLFFCFPLRKQVLSIKASSTTFSKFHQYLSACFLTKDQDMANFYLLSLEKVIWTLPTLPLSDKDILSL